MSTNRFQVLAPKTEEKFTVKEQQSPPRQKEKTGNIFKKNTFKKSNTGFLKNEFSTQKTTSKFGNNNRNNHNKYHWQC